VLPLKTFSPEKRKREEADGIVPSVGNILTCAEASVSGHLGVIGRIESDNVMMQ